ncbi:unnamed protein product [Moneuplotes crassus]|uniref:Uncharacterized protein n=1 Tax=Euplotes crassus TaxID=5936 RepID=A0AAD2D5S3_EUPCR|nr:unnamed protein product [Moneuplotes crassus]
MKLIIAILLFLLAVFCAAEPLDYRTKGVFSRDKTNGRKGSVRGFGLPKSLRKTNPKSTISSDDTPTFKHKSIRKMKQRGIQKPLYPLHDDFYLSSNLYAENIERIHAHGKIPEKGTNFIKSDDNIYTTRKALILTIIIMICIVFVFVKCAHIKSTLGESTREIRYRYKKLKFAKENARRNLSEPEESVKLLDSESRSCKTTKLL